MYPMTTGVELAGHRVGSAVVSQVSLPMEVSWQATSRIIVVATGGITPASASFELISPPSSCAPAR